MAVSNSIAPILAGTNASDSSLRAIKPPVELPDPWKWVWLGLGALLLASLGFLLWRQWKKRLDQMPQVPVVPAHLRAKQRLQEALALLAQPREFCITVSDISRGYLEERFAFHAPERTTEEFLYELRETNLLTPDQKEKLGEFLQRCDLVKFARYEPREPELRELHGSAVRLVEETEPAAELPVDDRPRSGGMTPSSFPSPTNADKAS